MSRARALFAAMVALAAVSLGACTERVNVSSNEVQANDAGINPSISRDGRYVAFESHEHLTPDDTGQDDDIFVWDRETGVTTRASVGVGGREGNASSFVPGSLTDTAISRTGRYVAFASSDDNLVPGDGNGLEESSCGTCAPARSCACPPR